jgi:hypothetical protein
MRSLGAILPLHRWVSQPARPDSCRTACSAGSAVASRTSSPFQRVPESQRLPYLLRKIIGLGFSPISTMLSARRKALSTSANAPFTSDTKLLTADPANGNSRPRRRSGRPHTRRPAQRTASCRRRDREHAHGHRTTPPDHHTPRRSSVRAPPPGGRSCATSNSRSAWETPTSGVLASCVSPASQFENRSVCPNL